MKHALTLIALLISTQLLAVEVPIGSYFYSSSKISFLKDVQVLQLRKGEDRERFENLRASNYQCQRFPNQVIKCTKFLKDYSELSLPTNLLRELAPTFHYNFKATVLSESDYVSTYEIEQLVTVKNGEAHDYRLYVNHGGISYADVLLKGHFLRFGYTDTQKLSMQIIMRETKAKGHWIEYGIQANYSEY